MKLYPKMKKRVYELLSPAQKGDIASLLVDIFMAILVLLSSAAVILDLTGITYVFGISLSAFEYITVGIFCFEYLLRVWTSDLAYPECKTRFGAAKEYVTSFDAFIDFISIASILFNQMPEQIALLRLIKLVKLARLVKISEHVKTSDSVQSKIERIQKRVNEIIDKGEEGDRVSRIYDTVSVALVMLSILFILIETFDVPEQVHLTLYVFEVVIACFFTLDYVLRVWTAPMDDPDMKPDKARMKYIFSFMSLIDLLSIVPVFVVNLPTAPGILKIFKLCKITRLIKMSRYLRAVANFGIAIRKKKKQIIFSLIAICIMIVISSVLMYSVEHKHQPEVFKNGFSGMEYCLKVLTDDDIDIEPVSLIGKLFATLMLLLGGCMFGVPVAIVSTGFEDMIGEQAGEEDKAADIYELMKQYDALSKQEQAKFMAYVTLHNEQDEASEE